MDRNGLLIIVLLLLFMIGFGESNALNSRKLVSNLDPDPKINNSSNSNQGSPSSSPPPDDKKPNLASVETPKTKDSPKTSPPNVEKGLTDTNNKTNSSDDKLDNGKDNVKNQKQLQTFDSKNCNGNSICSDQEKTMTACIQDFENGSNKLTLLVQNDRDTDVKVNITFGTSTNNKLTGYGIPSHKAEKVNITYSGDKSTKIILNAGNGDCELPITQPKTTPVENPSKSENTENTSNTKNSADHVDSPPKPKNVNTPVDSPPKVKEENDPSKVKDLDTPTKVEEENDPSKVDPKKDEDPIKPKNVDPQEKPPKDGNAPIKPEDENNHGADNSVSENLLYQLQLYSQKIEPIYGLYFGFLIIIIIGGSWVFCFKKRRTDGGVPYQELEMGLPESSNAVEVEPVEGWDQDWDDDDWDEDKAIRSPGGGIQTKSISSNGLTSRGTKKDGWDADWDD